MIYTCQLSSDTPYIIIPGLQVLLCAPLGQSDSACARESTLGQLWGASLLRLKTAAACSDSSMQAPTGHPRRYDAMPAVLTHFFRDIAQRTITGPAQSHIDHHLRDIQFAKDETYSQYRESPLSAN